MSHHVEATLTWLEEHFWSPQLSGKHTQRRMGNMLRDVALWHTEGNATAVEKWVEMGLLKAISLVLRPPDPEEQLDLDMPTHAYDSLPPISDRPMQAKGIAWLGG